MTRTIQQLALKLLPRSSPVLLMVLSSLLFAGMGVCVKLASAQYSPGEIVCYRGLIGMALMACVASAGRGTLRTAHPKAHFLRSVCGVIALSFWFYAISKLPLATAITLNYTASVWMALFAIASALMFGQPKVNKRLLAGIGVGFGGVMMILQPTISDGQWVAGVIGLLSGVLSAVAYSQVASLGRLGEPEYRVVFYFSMGSVVAGFATMGVTGFNDHSPTGILLLLCVGALAAAAQWAMTRAFSKGRTLVNASLQYLGIAYACVFGAMVFNDPVTPLALAGMALVAAAGVVAIFGRTSASRAALTR